MPTKNHRINVVFEEKTAQLLAHLAHQEHKLVASLVKELIIEGLKHHEDIALSALAESRDTLQTKRVKHQDAWK